MEGSDELLIQKYQSGETTALEELYLRHRQPLFNYIRRLVGETNLAEDILQEIFVRVIKKSADFDPQGSGSVKRWFYTIATNLCRDRHRRAKKVDELTRLQIHELEKSVTSEPANPLTREQELVQQVLDTLAPEQKEVVMLRIYSGLSFKEIGKVQNAPLNTVLARMHYALKKLRQHLGNLK